MIKPTEQQRTNNNLIWGAIQNKVRVISLNAGPGAGKTAQAETFVRAYAPMITLAGMRVLGLAFNRDAATELNARCKPIIQGSTFHAMGLSLLSSVHKTLKFTVDPYTYCNDARDYLTTNYNYSHGDPIVEKLTRIINSCLSLFKRDLDDAMLERWHNGEKLQVITDFVSGLDDINIDPSYDRTIAEVMLALITGRLESLLSGATNDYNGSGFTITYDDMIFFPVILGYRKKYHVVFVDESQDTNHIRDLFLRHCLTPDTMVLLGDRYQEVNGWNGAIHGYMDLFPDAMRLELTETMRYGNATIAWNADLFPGIKQTAYNPEHQDHVTQYASIQHWIDAYNGESVTMLSRTHKDIVILWVTLVKNGIMATLARDEKLPQQLTAILSSVRGASDPYDALGKITDYNRDLVEAAIALLDVTGSVREALARCSEMLGYGLCPKCNHALVERQAKKKNFRFVGCSNFPNCNFRALKSGKSYGAPITLRTIHSSKGLTVGHVVLYMPSFREDMHTIAQGITSEDRDTFGEACALYVAMTRHRHKLDVIDSTKIPLDR